MFPAQVLEAGFKLRQLDPSVGASVGTGTHAAVACAMTEKMDHGTLPLDSVAEAAGIEELERRIKADGVQWDPTTPNLNTAQRQVQRQYRSYRQHLAPRLDPVAVERRIELRTKKGNTLSGQVDLTTDGIRDLKTGTTARANHAQYGGYSILRRSEGGKVAHIVEDFVRRVPLDKEQPAPVEVSYDIQTSERIAVRMISEVETRYEEFMETGDPLAFTANPNSMLCMDRFCQAHGTEFCTEWKPR